MVGCWAVGCGVQATMAGVWGPWFGVMLLAGPILWDRGSFRGLPELAPVSGLCPLQGAVWPVRLCLH